MKKPIWVYLYISILVHMYLALLFVTAIQNHWFDSMAEAEFLKEKEPVIENVFVNTFTSSPQKPEKGKLSDKFNKNSSPKKGDNRYNLLNPDPQEAANPTAAPDEAKEKPVKARPEQKGEIPNNQPKDAGGKQGGNPETSYYEPEKKIEVEMDSEGRISLATVPSEFAEYFTAMQKKIGENWQVFFPIFQYYQGIIRNGDVVIRFQIDKDGNVLNPVIQKSYGYSILDNSCLNAVIYSRNFGTLPESLRKEAPININFRFIYLSR
ncbi:MAG: TonB family protein [Patescibacteria group bacterium]|nr:TonB family protein [Patescibacteria group bacterium]